jgi:hypothetical protein
VEGGEAYQNIPSYRSHWQKEMYDCAKLLKSGTEADGSRFMEVNKTYLDIKPKENARAGRLAWLGHLPDTQKVAGSSPARPTHFPSEKNLIGAHSPQKRHKKPCCPMH